MKLFFVSLLIMKGHPKDFKFKVKLFLSKLLSKLFLRNMSVTATLQNS